MLILSKLHLTCWNLEGPSEYNSESELASQQIISFEVGSYINLNILD